LGLEKVNGGSSGINGLSTAYIKIPSSHSKKLPTKKGLSTKNLHKKETSALNEKSKNRKPAQRKKDYTSHEKKGHN